MPKIDDKMIQDLEDLVKDAGLDPLPVEWISINNDNLSDALQGVIPMDIEYWEDGYMWFRQQGGRRDWTSESVYGVLEVIYDYGDHAVGFIREDMPLGTQANVVIHAYAHADFMKNHNLKKSYKNVMSSYIASVNQYRRTLSDYESKYGLDFIEGIEDLAACLSDVTNSFRKEDIFPTTFQIEPKEKFDKENQIFVMEEPDFPSRDEHDILYALMSIPWLSKPIKEILSIFRHRTMYTYPIKRLKVVDEGWASYWDSKLYIEAAKYLNISDFLVGNPYPKLPSLPFHKDGDFRYIGFSDFMKWLMSVLNDPYNMGFSFWKSKARNKDINLFQYAHSITNDELFENFELEDLEHTLNLVLPFEIDMSYFKDNEVMNNIIDFIKKYSLSRMTTSYIPRSGITKKDLQLNMLERPVYEWKFEKSSEPIRLGEKVGMVMNAPVKIESEPNYRLDDFSSVLNALSKSALNIDEVNISTAKKRVEDYLDEIGFSVI
jgi:hypothetical protein